MKGLLIKDIQLLKKQKSFFVMIFFLGIALSFQFETANFFITYVTGLIAFSVINTLFYDESNHGFSFLFTLPIKRNDYVLSKYILAFIIPLFSWMLTCGLSCLYYILTQNNALVQETLTTTFGGFLISYILVSLFIPMQLYFGQEKYRMGLAIVIGSVFGLGYLSFLLCDRSGIDLSLQLMQFFVLAEQNSFLFFTGLFIFSFALLASSYFLSVKIIAKKQF